MSTYLVTRPTVSGANGRYTGHNLYIDGRYVGTYDTARQARERAEEKGAAPATCLDVIIATGQVCGKPAKARLRWHLNLCGVHARAARERGDEFAVTGAI